MKRNGMNGITHTHTHDVRWKQPQHDQNRNDESYETDMLWNIYQYTQYTWHIVPYASFLLNQ